MRNPNIPVAALLATSAFAVANAPSVSAETMNPLQQDNITSCANEILSNVPVVTSGADIKIDFNHNKRDETDIHLRSFEGSWPATPDGVSCPGYAKVRNTIGVKEGIFSYVVPGISTEFSYDGTEKHTSKTASGEVSLASACKIAKIIGKKHIRFYSVADETYIVGKHHFESPDSYRPASFEGMATKIGSVTCKASGTKESTKLRYTTNTSF